MKTHDQELDTLIRDALSAEDRALFDRLGEPSLPKLITDTFRGRLRWMNALAILYTLVFFGLAIYCAVMVFQTEDVASMLRWGLGLLICIFFVAFLKLWFWLEIQRHALSREIKRVELAVAHLASELRSPGAPQT